MIKSKILHRILQNYGYIRSKAIALNKGKKRGKFCLKGNSYVLVGYSGESKAYRLWRPRNKNYYAWKHKMSDSLRISIYITNLHQLNLMIILILLPRILNSVQSKSKGLKGSIDKQIKQGLKKEIFYSVKIVKKIKWRKFACCVYPWA